MHGRKQTLGEEIANTLSHGLGLMLAVAALPLLQGMASPRGPVSVFGVTLYSVTMILVYLSSSIYHALPQGRWKALFNRIDHASIFLFIAGSYTPFALGAQDSDRGWTVFAVVWSLAAVGVMLKLLNRLEHPLLSTGFYMAMGWLVLPIAGPVIERLATDGLLLLVAGGLAYTVGAVFFLLDSRLRYAHLVWHLFVLLGSGCHFFATLWYAR